MRRVWNTTGAQGKPRRVRIGGRDIDPYKSVQVNDAWFALGANRVAIEAACQSRDLYEGASLPAWCLRPTEKKERDMIKITNIATHPVRLETEGKSPMLLKPEEATSSRNDEMMLSFARSADPKNLLVEQVEGDTTVVLRPSENGEYVLRSGLVGNESNQTDKKKQEVSEEEGSIEGVVEQEEIEDEARPVADAQITPANEKPKSKGKKKN